MCADLARLRRKSLHCRPFLRRSRARKADRTTVILIDTDPKPTTKEGGAWWDVAVPEVSTRPQVHKARTDYERARGAQRIGN